MKLPPSLEILRAVCAQRGLIFENMDPFSGYLARIVCPRTKAFFFAGSGTIPAYPGNDGVLTAIANDKAFTYALLPRLGLRAPEGEYFFLRDEFSDQRPPGKELDAAARYLDRHFAQTHAPPLVIKPNRLSHARAVSLARDAAEAMADLKGIAALDLIGHVQKLIDDPEFRLFIVKGEIIFAYRKGRPQILGDGRATIAALLTRAGRAVNPRYIAYRLSAAGLGPQSVLAEGAVLPVDFIANLSARGDFLGFVEPCEALRDWARHLHAALPLHVMGVDVFSRSALGAPEDFIVTDINASPALTTLAGLGQKAMVAAAWDRILDGFSPE
jgi:cyanophycin synthetase